MQGPELKTVKLANGETIGYRVSGEGAKPIVLVHGNLVSSKYWERLMPIFPVEYKVYAVDLRGVGLSSYNNPVQTIDDFADDLRQFIDAMGLDRIILAGWSMGGGVSQLFAAKYPAMVEKLVLVDSVSPKGFPYPDPATGEFLKTRDEVMTKGAGDLATLLAQKSFDGFKGVWDVAVFHATKPDEAWYKELVEDILTCRFFPDAAWAMHTFNISGEHNGVVAGTGLADRITMPVLVIRGDSDLIISQEVADTTVQVIGANAQLKIVPGTAHAPFIDQPEQFMALFTAFVV